MSPEEPGNLVVLDLRFRQEILNASIERVSPPLQGLISGFLRVRFSERTRELGFYPVGQDVARVSQPEGYVHSPREDGGRVQTLPGTNRYVFTNVASGEGLMLILILPRHFTLSDPDPLPRNAKVFRGRIAVYFKPEGRFGQSVAVTWALRTFDGSIEVEAERLRGDAVRGGAAPNNQGSKVDREDDQRNEAKLSPIDRSGLAGSEPPLSGQRAGLMALVAGIFGTGILLFFVYKVPSLVASGVQNQIFYILLVPWALCCAAFLFGALRSAAFFTGKHLGNKLELGGPVVLFCLVLIGGFKLVPQIDAFDLTVRTHPVGNQSGIIGSGDITIDLENVRRTEALGTNGEANFKGIPGKLKGAKVDVMPRVEGFDQSWQKLQITGSVLEISLRPMATETLVLRGTLLPVPKNTENVRVLVDGQNGEAKVDTFGRFDLPVQGRNGERVRLRVYSGSTIIYDNYETLPGPFTISIVRSR